MDSELRRDILSLVESTDGLRVLTAVESQAATDALRARHVNDPATIWWWTSLRPPTFRVSYGDADGLEVLRSYVPEQATVRLAATDDEQPPWLIVEGRIDALIEMLRELRIFEYWVAPVDGEWMVFDTHDNALIVAGALVDNMSSLAN